MTRTSAAPLGARASLVVFAVLLCVTAASAQSVPIPGPGRQHPPASSGGPVQSAPSIQALAVGKDSAVYAGSFGLGIYRSRDRGVTWEAASEGLTDPFVLCLAAAPDGTVYAGTFRGGVFRSKDGGRTWTAVNDGLKRLEVKALLIEGSSIFAGTGDGVYRLAEGEGRWAVVTKGLDEILVHSLAMAGDRTLYAGTSGRGVFRLKPSGTEWTRLRDGLVDHEGLVENFIRVLAVDADQAVYAGTFDGGVFRSADGGKTWRSISRALPNDSIRGIVASGKTLLVATGRGIFKTENQGQKWTPLNRGLTELSVQALIVAADGAFYAGTSAGVFRSDDEGLSWTGASAGIEGVPQSPFRFR